MRSLADDFSKAVQTIGMVKLKHPIFYNAPVGIRFEIGGNQAVYLDKWRFKNSVANPAYISAAFNRAQAIYTNLPHSPNILRIDVYPSKRSVKKEIQKACKAGDLPLSHEQVLKPMQCEEDVIEQFQLYWDLEKIQFMPDKLLKETIKGDIGGYNLLVSSVYYVDTYNNVLFCLYDDRGADLVASNVELLRPIYGKFNRWILDYDREAIDAIFMA